MLDNYPFALEHQAALISCIKYLLEMPDVAFRAFSRGNAFNKVIRNFQYYVAEKKYLIPYKSEILSRHYFRATLEAHEYMEKFNSIKNIHHEHSVPVAKIIERLLEFRALGLNVTEEVIMQTVLAGEIVLITNEQNIRLNSKNELNLKFKMPESWRWGDSHLVRIHAITNQIVGTRRIGMPSSD